MNIFKLERILNHQQHQIDGVLVAFINYIGITQCIDYALSVDDLNK